MQALAVLEKWTPELEAKIEKFLGNMPEQEMNFRERHPIPNRRTRQ